MRLPIAAIAIATFAAPAGCIGLEYYNAPIGDTAFPDTESDTDTDSDADTDTDTDSDADADTDTDILVEDVQPDYGPNGGGTEVVVTGGPFDGLQWLKFGSAQATIISSSSTEIRATTPSTTTTGAVDVKVSADAGKATLTSGFYFFADGAGLAGAVGGLEWVHVLGDYWTSPPKDSGYGWFLVIDPANVHYWSLVLSSADDTCASGFNSPQVSYFTIDDVASATFEVNGHRFSLPNDGTGYFTGDLANADWIGNSDYDLLDVPTAALPDLAITGVAHTASSSFTLLSPNLDTGKNIQTLSKSDLSFQWSNTSAQRIGLMLELANGSGRIIETVSCTALNDNSFSVPSSVWQRWDRNLVLYVLVGALSEGTGTVPFNGADSRVAGTYWLEGAAYTR